MMVVLYGVFAVYPFCAKFTWIIQFIHYKTLCGRTITIIPAFMGWMKKLRLRGIN